MKTFEDYLTAMIEAKTEAEREKIKQEFDLRYSDPKNKAEFIEFTKQKAKEFRNQLKNMNVEKSLVIGEITYSLREWMPIKDYCFLTGEKPAKISLQISRGNLTHGVDYIEVNELNNLRLIKIKGN